MYITFTAKAFYITLIAFLVSFVYGIIGFGALLPFIPDQDLLGEVFIPSYVVGFGILLVIVEAWWRLGDPEATVQILGLSTKVWGVLIALLGGYVFVDYVIKNGFTKEIGIAMGFTVVLNAIFIGIYFLRGYFYRKKHGKA